MLINKLFLDYFGRFREYEIDLLPGINLIYGHNEAGKSTIHTFIKGMLFGIERARGRASATKEDIYTRYLPWDYPGAFRGFMDIEIEDKKYRIHRSFHASDKSFTITDLETGREIKLKNDHISDIIHGLTESTYKNTISIEQQKMPTDATLSSALGNYLANLSMSKTNEINVGKALNSLTLQKRALEASLDPTERKALEISILEGEEKEKRLDALALQLQKIQFEDNALKEEKQGLLDQIDSKEIERMEQFPAIIEKYRSFLALTRQSSQIEEKQIEWQKRKEQFEEELKLKDILAGDLNNAKEINAELQKQNHIWQELQHKRVDIEKKRKRNFRNSLFPFGIVAILTTLITKINPIGMLIGGILLSAGFLCYAILNQSIRQSQKIIAKKEAEVIKKQSILQEKLSANYARNQVSSMVGLLQKQEEYVRLSYSLENIKQQLNLLQQQENETEDSMDVIYEEIMKYMQHFLAEDELSNDAIQRLQEEINRRRQGYQQRLRDIDRKLDANKIQIEKLKWEISTLEENEEVLLKDKTRYSELIQLQKENAVELEAIKLALNTIKELSVSIHDSFGNQLNTTVSDTIRKITNQKYSDIKVDEKLDIKVGWNGAYVPFDRLSTGTIDQIYLSLRLAVSDLLHGNNVMPVILDDSFVYYDESRVSAALQQLSTRKQVILFSCHKREQRLLEELKLPYHYIELQ
ncbi:MAG: AAA family ATPase [Clostridiales bacterium]|nr:AAA family ATPase [Clostridiales bacterium]